MRGIIPHCLGSQMKLVKSRSKLEAALRIRGQLERVGFWVIWSKVVLNKCMVFRPGAAGAPGDCLEMYILKSHSRPTGVAPSICVLISSLAHADVHSCLRITWRVCKTNKTKQNNKTIKQNNKTTPPQTNRWSHATLQIRIRLVWNQRIHILKRCCLVILLIIWVQNLLYKWADFNGSRWGWGKETEGRREREDGQEGRKGGRRMKQLFFFKVKI